MNKPLNSEGVSELSGLEYISFSKYLKVLNRDFPITYTFYDLRHRNLQLTVNRIFSTFTFKLAPEDNRWMAWCNKVSLTPERGA
ncbi:hypothetical protein QCH21_000395 [Enterobacter bugandensis]|uniref:hypothetical protein n=1 Tax=Enterobacter TaxID=547 RepID=UPI000FB290C6|nr:MULTISPECIES: hypothetical protein [Enterobacter]EKS7118512.1 hypothetical protein [Enterobacter bugandensis]EKX8545633.1 hypothetical protein [Enterobacter bugandensis]MBD0813103.1 hypothetical protein [Enterobacter sp. E12]MBE3209608.1 hypothetical protein [Enterobacter cloacae complex sp. P32C]MBT1785045.1 hypothetical protein [Enterobacter bugandensis]